MSAARVIAVVGAGLAGLRTAEALRRLGWTGRLVVIGAEPHRPYTRPPLSKKLLTAGGTHADVALRSRLSEQDVEWRLGCGVVAARLAERRLTLDDGTTVPYDGLVAASGVRARRLPDAVGRGGLVLRTVEDAAALSARLTAGTRVVVIGAGFIGCEVAAAATALGCRVTVVAADEAPMRVPLGPVVGAELRRRHAAAGVEFHLGVSVARVAEDAVGLGDGTRLAADVVVQAIGSRPNTAWLRDNDLDLTDGVRCDAELRIAGWPGAVAVGDVARFPNALFDAAPRRIEHWQIAADTGLPAARTLLRDLDPTSSPATEPGEPFTTVPTFWSDQGVVSLRSFGLPGIGTECAVLEGELTGEAAIGYRRDGELVGVVLLGMARASGGYLRQLTEERQAATKAMAATTAAGVVAS